MAVLRLHAFLDELVDRCSAICASQRAMFDLVVEIVGDQAHAAPEHQLALRFAQLVVGNWALNQAQQVGDLSACGDWVGWSLSETIETVHVVTIEVSRLDEFRASDAISSWRGFDTTLISYLGCFYYYARRRAAMREVGIGFWPIGMPVLLAAMAQNAHRIHPSEAALGNSMLAWASIAMPEEARRLTTLIEVWVDDAALPAAFRATFAINLATGAGQFSGRSQADWARRALQEFGAHLVNEQKVLMLATLFDASDEAQVENILVAMDECQAPLRQRLSSMAFAIEASGKSDVVHPFVSRCLAVSRADIAVRGIVRWYQGPTGGDAIDPSSVIVFSPFDNLGYVAGCHLSFQRMERDSQALLLRQTQESNAFLGAALTVALADNDDLQLPERPGVPDMDDDAGWFATLREVYCPAAPPEDESASAQLTFVAAAHPVQAVQLASWGRTWPIAASLSSPLPDRAPRTVALWSGGGSMTEEMELTMVRAAFEAAGAVVEMIRPADGTRDRFLSVYEDPRFDVIWVASHGEFDHWSPRSAELRLGAEEAFVTLEHLIDRAPRHEGRRLLMLNVCDGARFEEGGLAPRIGLAVGLAGAQQATVSHLWPVRHVPSAAFGVYLAYFIAAGVPFFDAYVRTLAAMRKPSPAIADELLDLFGLHFDLLDRLRAQEVDYTPLQYSGSLAFFQ